MPEHKDSTSKEAVESHSFEDSFLRLSEMAEQLEAGGLTLAEATARFEEGMKLVQFCNDMLNNAELKITELRTTYQMTASQSESQYVGDEQEEVFDE